MSGQKGVAIVGKSVSKGTEGGGLIFGDEKLGGCEAIQLIFELRTIRILGHSKLSSGVIDAGEAEFFPMLIDSCEVVGSLIVE